jgi:hypothetical protein
VEDALAALDLVLYRLHEGFGVYLFISVLLKTTKPHLRCFSDFSWVSLLDDAKAKLKVITYQYRQEFVTVV